MSVSGWQTRRIESLIEDGIIRAHKDGNYGSSYPRKYEFGDEGVPFLTAKLLNDSGRIAFEDAPRLGFEKAGELTYGYIEVNDVLLSHNATIGRVAVVPELKERVLVGTSLTYYRLDPDRLLPRYLAAYFKGRDFQNQLVAVMSHSTRNQVPITAQRKLDVIVPPMPEQRRIADILGSFDDKIELHQRMNQTLEAMVGRLFRSWFVDFDPVHAKAAVRREHPKWDNARISREALPKLEPAVAEAFPDELEGSKLGLIPKGWRVGTVGDVADNPKRTTKPHEIDPSTPYIALEHIPRRHIGLNDWTIADGVASGKYRFNAGEILFGKLRPYFHKVGVAPITGVCSTDVLVIVPSEPAWRGFALGHISSDEMISHTDGASTGTKMPRTNWEDIARFAAVIPSIELAETFDVNIGPVLEQLRDNVHEARSLAETRDRLLPKLLSGKTSVPTRSERT